jgi:lipopolysaccharide biosynthesis regulator YciM
MNDLDSAIEACERAIKQHANNPSPQIALSHLYAAQGDYETAITKSMRLPRVNTGLLRLALSEPAHSLPTALGSLKMEAKNAFNR